MPGIRVSIAKFEEIAEALGLEPRELILAPGETQPAALAKPLGTRITKEPALPMTFYAYDEGWVGREALVAELAAQVQDRCRLLIITGIAGVGKTALAERLSLELSAFGVPLRETAEVQDQGLDFGSFAAQMLEQLGEGVTPSDRTDRPQLLARLMKVLQTRRQLLLIDSLEEWLQGNEQEGWSKFKDEGFLQFFQQVLAADSFQSRIILTSQELPSQLLAVGTRYRNHWATQLLTGLSAPEQLALFDKTGLGVSPDAEGHAYLVRMGQAYEGHPLALRIIAGEIGSRPYFGNVVAYWQRYGQEIEVVENAIAAAAAGQAVGTNDRWQLDRFTQTLHRNVRQRLEHTFQRLRQEAKFAYILLCEAAVYRCAVPEDWWLSHLDYWDCAPEKGLLALDTLRDRFLVEEAICPGQGFANEAERYTLRQHSLIRSVALEHFQHLDELV